ncbi:pro-epidermal growth factor isoform X2 [Esox lucius]|uniref:pro-epidermal growth factor isoform X2 n=1 Tax=Esox lucius TaxID=8010 RepID=UPI001477252B|nr:pro-epidermal growth factor isoform X2 [Esox lucius]
MLVEAFAAVLVYFAVKNVEVSADSAKACWRGNQSGWGNRTCLAPEPYVIYGHGQAIYRMDLDGRNQRRIVAGVGNSILLDFHYIEKRVYWVNTKTGVIYKTAMNGTKTQKLYSSEKGISGLAVDWVHNFVIWTCGEKGTIKRVDTNGKNERTLLRRLSHPISIAVAPNDRFIFWLSDGITPSIQRSDLTGKMITTVLKIPERLGALAVDRTDKRLFWVQFSPGGESAFGSCDYNGNVIHVIAQPLQTSVGISVFLEHIYYNDERTRTIRQVNKYSGGDAKSVNPKRMAHPPMHIKVVHPLNQPAKDSTPVFPACDGRTGACVNVCSNPADQGGCQCTEGFALSKQGNYCEDVNECGLWDHGCSLGCENIPGSYFCTCPKGYALLPDRKTCRETTPCPANVTRCDHGCLAADEGTICVCPEGSVIQPDGQSCTGCSSSDRGGCSHLCVPITPGRWECDCLPGYELHRDGKRCRAIGPPPYLLYANIVGIRHVNLDGTGDHSVMEEPRGALKALDYDPVQNKMYFASTVVKQIERAGLDGGSREILIPEGLDSPEGLAVDWVNRKLYWTDRGLSSIERSTLDGFGRLSVVSRGIQKPRGVAVHPSAKKLFWTDMGSSPVVESASLEGGDRAIIASAGLVSPSGLTIDFTEDKLYWCDSGTGALDTSSLDGSNRRTLTENQVGRPFDLVVFEDRLWITDWEGQMLLSIDKRTGLNPERLHGNGVQPASVVVVHPLAKPGANVCTYQNGGCAQVCESRLGLAHCSCHSQFTLSADNKGCLPTNATVPDSEDGESAEPVSLKNQTLNDEGVPGPLPGLSSAGEVTDEHTVERSEPTLFTEKMVSDQDDCFSLHCDVNAQCVLDGGSPTCRCLVGFTGDGQLCLDVDECVSEMALCGGQSLECVNTAGGYYCQCRSGFSLEGQHCTDIDECMLGTHQCDQRAECVNTMGTYRCACPAGHITAGHTCQEPATTFAWASTRSPVDVTSHWVNPSGVESCPSSHDAYCFYEGVCFYLPEMESYACKCIAGYMGERCQFSDLEWWELQQTEHHKRRNVAVAVSMLVLITLLSIAACITYCYGSRKFFQNHSSVDDMSETSSSDVTMSETTVPSTPSFYVVLEHDGKVLHVMNCPTKAVCPSCSSETDESFLSEHVGTPPRLNQGYDCSTLLDTNETDTNHLKSMDNLIFLEDPQPASTTPQLI